MDKTRIFFQFFQKKIITSVSNLCKSAFRECKILTDDIDDRLSLPVFQSMLPKISFLKKKSPDTQHGVAGDFLCVFNFFQCFFNKKQQLVTSRTAFG
jgi:hypothetical protein